MRVVRGWGEGGERVVRVNYHSWEICVVRWWV